MEQKMKLKTFLEEYKVSLEAPETEELDDDGAEETTPEEETEREDDQDTEAPEEDEGADVGVGDGGDEGGEEVEDSSTDPETDEEGVPETVKQVKKVTIVLENTAQSLLDEFTKQKILNECNESIPVTVLRDVITPLDNELTKIISSPFVDSIPKELLNIQVSTRSIINKFISDTDLGERLSALRQSIETAFKQYAIVYDSVKREMSEIRYGDLRKITHDVLSHVQNDAPTEYRFKAAIVEWHKVRDLAGTVRTHSEDIYDWFEKNARDLLTYTEEGTGTHLGPLGQTGKDGYIPHPILSYVETAIASENESTDETSDVYIHPVRVDYSDRLVIRPRKLGENYYTTRHEIDVEKFTPVDTDTSGFTDREVDDCIIQHLHPDTLLPIDEYDHTVARLISIIEYIWLMIEDDNKLNRGIPVVLHLIDLIEFMISVQSLDISYRHKVLQKYLQCN